MKKWILAGMLCMAVTGAAQSDAWVQKRLLGHSPVVDTVLAHPDQYRVQILYTQIDRDRQGRPRFTSYAYRTDLGEYFYPASTVKLPAAVLSLEKLRDLHIPGLDLYTPMLTDSASAGQTAVWVDSTSANGMPSVGHYAKKILLVSDNDAFNRLYEWLGQAPLNNRLHALGYTGTRIVHRLALPRTREQNRHTNPVRFVRDGQTLYAQPEQVSTLNLRAPEPIPLGRGEYVGDSLVWNPKDFAGNNAFPIREQQALLRQLIFPGSVPQARRLRLEPEDYRFIWQYMSQLPAETTYPAYDPAGYPDSYVKFLMYGDSARRIPSHIRIFNKVGIAYGFVTDNAYIVDLDTGVEFMLTATVHVNADGIFNDDQYEYDTVGLPFMAALGQIIYQHECHRPRKHKPDLSAWRLTYDQAHPEGD
ncbi:MAG: serine hydrolase [Bacteroidia bacterium]|nr:serine hydrolase [Bacteroidia bacterium]